MSQRAKTVIYSLVIVLVSTRAYAEITAEEVREAIDRGVAYLEREQNDNGSWPDPPGYPGGITALCTLALLNCGVTADDPHVQSALNFLRKLEPTVTYATALQTMVFAAAEPKTNLPLIRRNAQWLAANQKDGAMLGAWGYPQADGDNSNSQFALLALHEAERVGVEINDRVWKRALDYWRNCQNPNGSWGYKPNTPGSGSMTCAGIAAMVIASDRLNKGDAQADGDQVTCCGEQQDNGPVERGLNWLGDKFSVNVNPGGTSAQGWLLYYLYGLERAGRLTNRRLIGEHDWYREGAEVLITSELHNDLSGYWKGSGHAEDNPHIATSLALLFLAKGRRPVLCAKLKHGVDDDWNHHRSDLGNLTGYVESRWGRDLTWQIIDAAAATTDDLLEAPVVYISGSQRPRFSNEQIERLRAYINRGGFILAEACCEGEEFEAGFKALTKRMFPEPEYQLHDLPFDHPAYTADERVDIEAFPINKPLKGIDVGCRTSVIYVPHELRLSCFWELARLGRERKLSPKVQAQLAAARSLGINILAYATNREVKYKLELDNKPLAAGESSDAYQRAVLRVAKGKHSGGWNAAPGALLNLLQVTAEQTGMRVDIEQNELSISSPALMDYQILFLHGRNAFQLSDEDRQQLKTYVDRGGVLMADAVCGSAAFAKAFRREMQAVFGRPVEPIPPAHPLFTSKFGGFDLKRVRRRNTQRRGDGPIKASVEEVEPELEGIAFDDRYGVIFSPLDISCALERHESIECPGYLREDAAKIGLNVVLYALEQ